MRALPALLAWALCAVLAACATPARHPGLQGAEALPPLIPARAFFANTASQGAHQVSPDGQHVAWVGVQGTGPVLWVRPAAGEGLTRWVARGVTGFQWAPDSRHVLFGVDRQGDENTHVMALDTQESTQGARDLTPFAGVKAWVHPQPSDDTQHIWVWHNQRDRRFFDLYRIHLLTGRQVLVHHNPGDTQTVILDSLGEPVAWVRREGATRRLFASFAANAPPRELVSWGLDDDVTVLSADRPRQGFYLLSNRGRDRKALVFLDAQSQQETVLAQDTAVDIEQVLLNPTTGQPLAAWGHPGHQRVVWLDAAWQRDLARLLPPGHRQFTVQSLSRDARLAIVVVDSDGERHTLLLKRSTGESVVLGQGVVNAYRGQLGVTQPVSFTARDGLPLHGYLTLPPGARPQPGPMVLLVHGGPWARDWWDNSLGQVQFLANRGYAVLQVNYRGSAGYGREFMQAAIGEFAGKMHLDLLDAVQWAVAEQVADPQRVAIMGGSYGGYATLVGLSFTPEVFACGVDVVGVSNLVTLVEDAPAYWAPEMHLWHRYVGDPRIPAQRERMWAQSPLSRVSAITQPLLVIHTTNDVRVKQNQADILVQALRAQGKPVDYLLLGNAGHSLGSWSWGQRLRAHRHIEDFLSQCLGGRSGGFDLFEAAAWVF